MFPRALLILVILLFTGSSFPLIDKRSSRENVAERQAQTAGMVRLYCKDSSRTVLDSPQIPFGKNSFNMELSLFEWIEGRVAAAWDGPRCDSVEKVMRAFALFCTALALVIVFEVIRETMSSLGFRNAGWAGFVGAVCLATDQLWLKFSTFTLVDSRMVACSMLAYLLIIKRRWFLALLFWILTIGQKPQAFAFIGPFYVCLDLVLHFLKNSVKKISYWNRDRVYFAAILFAAVCSCAVYMQYSVHINESHDLPWLAWMGPKLKRWMFGNWNERWELAFYKSQILEWFRKCGLFLLPLAVFLDRENRNRVLKTALLLSIPFFVGRFLHTFIFLNVFKAHDYYAIPQNGLGELSRGLVFGTLLTAFLELRGPDWKKYFATAAVAFTLFLSAWSPVREHIEFVQNIENPKWDHYLPHWHLNIFPDDDEMVVMANPGRGRDYLDLYLTRHPGHIWCNYNKEFAPRAYWKSEGVRYVAWAEGKDPATGDTHWVVRTMEEELARARANGWSSDINDAWAGKSMAQWAAMASSLDKDPCEGDPKNRDPRVW